MINFLLLLIAFIFLLFEFLFNTMILQNQFYSLKRFFLILKTKKKHIALKLFLIFLCVFLINKSNYFIFIVFLSCVHKNKNMKITFTNRTKRFLLIFIILFAFNIPLSFLLTKYNYIKFIMITYNLLLYYISHFVSIAIESIIQKYYIKNAKRKLKFIKPVVIGITGSFGKTSVKNYATTLLKEKYNVLSSPKSYNTLMGITKTINEQLKPYHQVLILEIGVDKKNGMNKFLKNYQFDIGVVTCVGKQHLKTFKKLDNIYNEKKKILDNATYASIYRVEDYDQKQIKAPSSINFSSKSSADIKVNKENDKVIIYYKNNIIESKTKLIGEHNLSNLACALSIAFLLNVDCDDIKKTLPTINNVEHRLNILTMNNWILLDDSYNSNHIGFINALKTLNEFKMKKVLITPGIIEQNKESIGEEISLSTLINDIVDIVILIKKPKIKQYINHYIEFNSFNEAIEYLKMNYINEQLAILIENDLPEIYLR